MDKDVECKKCSGCNGSGETSNYVNGIDFKDRCCSCNGTGKKKKRKGKSKGRILTDKASLDENKVYQVIVNSGFCNTDYDDTVSLAKSIISAYNSGGLT